MLTNARYGEPSEDVKRNVYQWDAVYRNDDMFKGGWAGRGLLVNPDKDLAAVYTGYISEEGNTTDLLPTLRRIFNALYP